MEFILGSQSPRRKEILEYFDFPFVQIKPDFDEESVPFDGTNPGDFAVKIAHGKAESIAKQKPTAYILTADTVVFQNGRHFAKAANYAEAFEVLSLLCGHWHSVFTGVCLWTPKGIFEGFEETKILFNQLSHEEKDLYLKKIHWQDKAGNYSIQGAGSLVIKEIQGCYYNAAGLPVNTLNGLLAKAGIRLWNHLK